MVDVVAAECAAAVKDDDDDRPPSWPLLLALRLGTDPKAGADGATGGGDTSLAGRKVS